MVLGFFKYVKTRKLLFLITSKPKELEIFSLKTQIRKKKPSGFLFLKPTGTSGSKCSHLIWFSQFARTMVTYTLLEPILWFFCFCFWEPPIGTCIITLITIRHLFQCWGIWFFWIISSFGYLKRKSKSNNCLFQVFEEENSRIKEPPVLVISEAWTNCWFHARAGKELAVFWVLENYLYDKAKYKIWWKPKSLLGQLNPRL